MHDGAALAQVFTLGAYDCCTGFCLTLRWREVDSNHRYRPAIATELQARCVPDDMWMPVP